MLHNTAGLWPSMKQGITSHCLHCPTLHPKAEQLNQQSFYLLLIPVGQDFGQDLMKSSSASGSMVEAHLAASASLRAGGSKRASLAWQAARTAPQLGTQLQVPVPRIICARFQDLLRTGTWLGSYSVTTNTFCWSKGSSIQVEGK